MASGFEAEPTRISPSSQLTRQEKLGQEGVFGVDQEPSAADTQGSAASDASSFMGVQPFPPPREKDQAKYPSRIWEKQSLCLRDKEKSGQVLGT